MVEPGCSGSSVRFFCTAGNGMETFLTEEVKKKLLAEDVCQIPGKVLFSSSAAIHRVTSLKAAERLFLLLKKDSPLRMPTRCSRAEAASLLQSRLLANRDQWIGAAVTWSRLQRELLASKGLGGTARSQRGGGTEDFAASKKHRSELREPQREEQHVEKPPEKKRMKEDGAEAEIKMESNSFCSKICLTGDDEASESVENVSFRISCKCSGSVSRSFSSQEVSRMMGAAVSRLLGWKADLKNPLLEVSLHLSDDYCLLGIPLTRLPLANRSYIKTTGLRSTVAWAMASLADIQPGFSVVDPMCGVGTILIEAAQEHQDACFVGVDIDDGQLQRANHNVLFAHLGKSIQLLKASSMGLPLLSGTVDAVVCDLPFGRKFGSNTNMAADLPLILWEMERILCPGGTLVVLLSPQLSCLLKKLLTQEPAEPALEQKAEPQAVAASCLSSSSPPDQQLHSQDRRPAAGLQQRQPPRRSSLKHQATFRVSLGAIDGLIQKYVKT
ncbi:THUMP domain-containing protein 2 isoform X1 [Oryzias latipes]|uniref:THUMP domain containing 2 n=1 Tax=Oryzias latipes TaxID=8090 RepID=H2L9V7_ORYLA|nr:THUMP domain-containing protein 2 isoform X1 [Oryzias latipes]